MATTVSELSTPIEIVPGADLTLTFLRYTGAQLVTVTGTPTGGTFRLKYKGTYTSNLAYNAAAAVVQAALEHGGMGLGNVAVTGSAGGPYTVTVQGALDPADTTNDFPLLDYDASSLTGGTSPSVTVTRPLQDTTGYTYDLQARLTPGSADPTLRVTSTANANGDIITNDNAGTITVTISATTTGGLPNSGTPPAAGNWSTVTAQAGFVLVEIVSTVKTPVLLGFFTREAQYYV